VGVEITQDNLHPTPRRPRMPTMHLSAIPNIAAVPASLWDALIGEDNPFVEHAFLHGLEITGCVGPRTGWTPMHLVATSDDLSSRTFRDGCQLLGAVPLYLRTDSFGEFIFDWSWAHFCEQHGVAYYPKLASAVPFTPVTGPRMLLAPDTDPQVAEVLAQGTRDLARQVGAHSVHWLFLEEARAAWLENHGWLHRATTQALWRNPGYRDFDDFLSTRTARIRKQIRRERRDAQASGLALTLQTGPDMGDAEWAAIWQLYQANVTRHESDAYLNDAFFRHVRDHLAHRVVCTFARGPRGYVAGTFNVMKGKHLYGRYWGNLTDTPFLHFELAFYRLMDYCIANGLRRFEAGAGGAHKLQRGMELTAIHSAHWLDNPMAFSAIAAHVAAERRAVQRGVAETRDPTRRQA